MANTISTFTGLVHPKSTVIKVMENLSLNACVQLYIPSGTDEQREQLDEFIHGQILCRVPGHTGRRQFIYCRYNPEFSDACILSSYTAVLQAVFGTNTRAHARVYKKEGSYVELATHSGNSMWNAEQEGNLYPNTEFSVDLKMLTRRPGRMKKGEQLSGTLSRDSEEHFTFIQDALEKESTPKKSMPAPTRYPHAYEGKCFNVSRRADGNLYPTFCQPHYSEDFSFLDFCREAAEELLMVARAFENLGLVEESNGK